MHRDLKTQKLAALFMAAVMTFTSLPLGGLKAGMVSTGQLLDEDRALTPGHVDQGSERSRVQTFLARDDVRAEMMALGVTAAEAEARVAAMTDQEVAELAGRLDELPAGGVSVGTVLLFLFVAFGAAVIIDALGLIDIFPFVCGRGPCGQQQIANAEQRSGQIPEDDFAFENRNPIYQNERLDRSVRDDRRRFRDDDRRFQSNEQRRLGPDGFEPQPEQPSRNYFEERFGARQVR